MDIPIRKLVTTIIILSCIVIVLFVIVRKTEPIDPNENTLDETNIVQDEKTEDEKLQEIIEETIKENDNIIVNNNNQVITYDPQELD